MKANSPGCARSETWELESALEKGGGEAGREEGEGKQEDEAQQNEEG